MFIIITVFNPAKKKAKSTLINNLLRKGENMVA